MCYGMGGRAFTELQTFLLHVEVPGLVWFMFRWKCYISDIVWEVGQTEDAQGGVGLFCLFVSPKYFDCWTSFRLLSPVNLNWTLKETSQNVIESRMERYLLKGRFSIRTSMSKFKSLFVEINLRLVSLLSVKK